MDLGSIRGNTAECEGFEWVRRPGMDLRAFRAGKLLPILDLFFGVSETTSRAGIILLVALYLLLCTPSTLRYARREPPRLTMKRRARSSFPCLANAIVTIVF